MHSRKNRQIFECGYIVAGRYKILKLIGQGGYGDIYSVDEITDEEFNNSSNLQDNNDSKPKPHYAMKIESLTAEKKGLDLEIEILTELQDSPFFPHIHERGMTQTHRFLVMELFGPSVSNTRRQMPSHKFSLTTALRLGIFMIECIRSFHQHGFVHRDIKPGNFLLRCPHYLIEPEVAPSGETEEINTNSNTNNAINDNNKDHSPNIESPQRNTNNEQSINNNNISSNDDNNNNNNRNIDSNNDVNNNVDSNSITNDNIKTIELSNNNENKSKSSNITETMCNPLALIDFGLSKRYIDPETSLPYPEKNKAGFRGTCKYASVYAHNFHDQCPRDDLISWCYSMVELVEGYLPWGNLRENTRVRQIKSQFLPKNLFRSLPHEFIEIWRYLNSLSYNVTTPKYDYIIQLITEPFYNYILNKNNMISSSNSNLNIESNKDDADENKNKNKNYTPFDWEILTREQIESYSGVSRLPSARNVPLPQRIGGGLITENDDTQTFGNGSKCVGCLIS